MLHDKRILLIISGGIAAYKVLDLIRLIRKDGGTVTCILTKGGEQFVTPLSVASLSERKVYTDLWSLTDETEMGHIRLSRENDLIVVAPASADIIAKMAHGLANDLASTTLLAADKPILLAPAMNHKMWDNPATQENIETLTKRGLLMTGPTQGDMACGETGMGRMSEPADILQAIKDFFFEPPLKGQRALVTSGPTYESIDPVRFLGNRSSGKQGHAIAKALYDAGADVTLISGPSALPDIAGIKTVHVESAQEMLAASLNALPADICICAAAVSDWTPQSPQQHKIKKNGAQEPPRLLLKENPDILKTIGHHDTQRPKLVIGFAAETDNLEDNAQKKLNSKGCDWILANHVGKDEFGNERAFGSDENQIYLITHTQSETWDHMSKTHIAKRLVDKIATHINDQNAG
tara:strand:- start:202 stop:1425 length:1224 start_codon:yes stop_codon:yes gene_type:complete